MATNTACSQALRQSFWGLTRTLRLFVLWANGAGIGAGTRNTASVYKVVVKRRSLILTAGFLTIVGLIASAEPAAAKGSFQVVVTGGDLRHEAVISPQQILDLSQHGASGQFPIWGMFKTTGPLEFVPFVPSIVYQLRFFFILADQKDGPLVLRLSYYPAMGAQSALARVQWFDSEHSPGWSDYARSWLALSPGFEKLVNDTITSAGGSPGALRQAVLAPIESYLPLTLLAIALVAAVGVVAGVLVLPRTRHLQRALRALIAPVQVGDSSGTKPA